MLNSALRVRRLTAADAAALSGLCTEHAVYERAATPPVGHAAALARWLRSQHLVAFGAEDATGLLRGYASLTVDISTWRAAAFAHLDCLYLCDAFRGAGHGHLLMKAVRDHATSAGLAVMEWQTPMWNAPAQRFYQRQGASCSVKQRYTMAL